MADPMEQQLIDAVRADPDADGPRLVYADWLEEQGQLDRAQVVRAQLAEAQLPSWDLAGLHHRIDVLRWARDHAAAWRRGLPRLEGVTWGPRVRGFVGHATFDDTTTFAQHVDACRAATLLDDVTLPWPRFGHSLPHAALQGLRSLTLQGELYQPEAVDSLAAAAELATLRTLRLQASGLESSSLSRLVASPHLAGLTRLEVSRSPLGDEAVFDLVESGSMTQLRHLGVTTLGVDQLGSQGRDHDTVSDAGLGVLAAWGAATSLRSLDLSGNELSTSLQTLLSSDTLAGLHTLALRDLGGGRWSAMRLEPFVDAASELQLRSLDLSNNSVDLDGVGALADAHCLAGLVELKVRRLYTGDAESFRRLVAAPWFDELQVLDVGAGDPLLWTELLVERAPKKLHALTLGGRHRSGVLATLARSPLASQLVRLTYHSRSLDPVDVGAMEDRPDAFERLRWLVLPRSRRPQEHETFERFRASVLGQRLDVLSRVGDPPLLP
ncbi:MAG: TIGR02996 domain-containing protein [Myxococcales bacterium]|nr:TIGR02996 domain-containing protein [Myxococcales bacterium]